MIDPTTALTTAIENSTKVASTPFFSTVIDKLLGYKISEWNAQGGVVKRQILDGYEEAKARGLALQYVSTFRSNTNLINIGAKAAQYIEASRTDEIDIENDVFWGLLDHAKGISNDEMQELIAKIIAGEYNAPGSYSMSTLHVVKMLGRYELEIFERMCSLLIDGEKIPEILFSLPENARKFLGDLDVDFGSLQLLQSLSLFFPNEMTKTLENEEKKKYKMNYFDRSIRFAPITPEDTNTLKIIIPGFYALTLVGKQLLKHLHPQPNNDYFSWLKENYKITHYSILEGN